MGVTDNGRGCLGVWGRVKLSPNLQGKPGFCSHRRQAKISFQERDVNWVHNVY